MKSKTDIRTLSEKELNARLVRDLTEACPAGEREALAAWRAADPAHEEEYARIRSYWNARVTTTRSIDPEREFRKLQRRIAAGSESRRSGMLRLLATRMGRYASMAAMLAVGLFCGWALSGPRAAERFAFITGSSISSFELPDGSRITLDKESRLEYDGDFGRDERNVRLVGKGFFEVEKMPDKRFVVEMGDVQVSVLGTTFDASNRTEEGIVSASLVEGSVAFRAGNQNLRLTPSRRAVYHVGSGEITVTRGELFEDLLQSERFVAEQIVLPGARHREPPDRHGVEQTRQCLFRYQTLKIQPDNTELLNFPMPMN